MVHRQLLYQLSQVIDLKKKIGVSGFDPLQSKSTTVQISYMNQFVSYLYNTSSIDWIPHQRDTNIFNRVIRTKNQPLCSHFETFNNLISHCFLYFYKIYRIYINSKWNTLNEKKTGKISQIIQTQSFNSTTEASV